MSEKVGVVRDANGLSEALSSIVRLERETDGDPQLANMLTTAKLWQVLPSLEPKAAARISAATTRRRLTRPRRGEASSL